MSEQTRVHPHSCWRRLFLLSRRSLALFTFHRAKEKFRLSLRSCAVPVPVPSLSPPRSPFITPSLWDPRSKAAVEKGKGALLFATKRIIQSSEGREGAKVAVRRRYYSRIAQLSLIGFICDCHLAKNLRKTSCARSERRLVSIHSLLLSHPNPLHSVSPRTHGLPYALRSPFLRGQARPRRARARLQTVRTR